MAVRFARKRSEILEELSDNAADSMLQLGDKELFEHLKDIQRRGLFGYEKYSNIELVHEFNNVMDPFPKLSEVLDDEESQEPKELKE